MFLVRSGPLRLDNRQTRDQGTVRKSLPACTESAARQHQVLARSDYVQKHSLQQGECCTFIPFQTCPS